MQINSVMSTGCPACQGTGSMDRGNASAENQQAFNRGMQGQCAGNCEKSSSHGQGNDTQDAGGQQNEQMMAMLMQLVQQIMQMIQGSGSQSGDDANSGNNQQQAKDKGDATEEGNTNKIGKNDTDSNCNCG